MKVFSCYKLAILLKDSRFNMSGIARAAGITPNTLWRIKAGRNKPDSDTLAAIADAFMKPIDYFYEDVEVVNHRQKQLELQNASGNIRAKA